MKWDTRQTEELLKAILVLKTLSEAKRFFRDLLTESEIIEFGNRWQAAVLLSRQVPYAKIERATGLSSTTVARISKWLRSGMGGYQFMLTRLYGHRHTLPPVGSRLR